MPHSSLIAVVLPAYNAEKFIGKAIQSVIDQTFREWELIVVDDCSTDATLAIARQFASADSRIHVIHNDRNLREGGSRNVGIAAVSPAVRLIATMDADDCCHCDRLAKQKDFMEKHPEIAVCGSSMNLMDENGQLFACRNYPCGSKKILRFFCRFDCFAHPTTMFRREIFEEFHYRENCRCVDYELLFRILERYDGDNLPDILLDYRISSTQQKSQYVKEILRNTIFLQSGRLFRKRFFNPVNIFFFVAECLLLLLPSSWILKLFTHLTYRSKKNSCR